VRELRLTLRAPGTYEIRVERSRGFLRKMDLIVLHAAR
jgi:hypothetical protein